MLLLAGFLKNIVDLLDSESSVTQFQLAETLSSASLTAYKSLNGFVSRVSEITEQIKIAREEQPLRLVTLLAEIRDEAWADIKGVMAEFV